jgi:hypothetical protein
MKKNKQTVKENNSSIAHAIDEHFARIKSLMLAGDSYTPATLKAIFLANNDAIGAVESKQAELRQLLLAKEASDAKTSRVRRALKSYLLGLHGPEAVALLAEFGFAPARATPNLETRALAVQKMLATRKARHTMGRRQRERIKGEAPPEAPNPPVPTPSPAPPPGGGGPPAAVNGAASGAG